MARTRTSTAAAGERFASINPATGEVLGYVSAAGPAQIDAAVRAAQARPDRMGCDDGRGACARAAPRRPPAARAQPGARRARNARHRQAHPGNTGRRRDLRRGLLRVLCEPCAILERRAHRSRRAGLRLHAPRAARRRRRHRRMELPAADRLLEGGAGAGVRQRHDLQAGRAHAVQRREARGDPAARPDCRRACSRWCRALPIPAVCSPAIPAFARCR